MARRPTPKQVRAAYAKVLDLRRKLQDAVQDAYKRDIIVYEHNEEHVVCNTLWQFWEHFEAKTEKQLAAAMKDEIRKELA